ncbi:conjugal transfer protein TraG [Chromobacterium haemolyticum]|uniref:Conjugal transfer protein TraG n=1 Tax=Chromobacterium fluminis TaxID=3044269 RepID=A0ABX0L7K2_9NEIS|nr:conjugal transfer protein TraG N-terminal domain-containing protein [Chromobacterium haemolyticum]NHR07794.1 conjugal transfer protein TraG [Chromobacterium haemolyticum]
MEFLVYTTGDISILNTIFNGVAMVCQQNVLIWGFAVVAALYSVLTTTAKTSVQLGINALSANLSNGSLGVLIPMLIAFSLTAPPLKTDVQLESTKSGAMSLISNVPVVIAIIPSTASILTHEIAGVVSTAFQGAGTNYDAISAGTNGFINPLKVLLSARSTVVRLNAIDSEISSVVASCLNSNSGTDYARLRSQVMNAGNSGANQSRSLAVSGYTSFPTGVGALLYAAAQNQTGTVPDLQPNSQIILSCTDAAIQVAQDIDNALSSPEFARVVQGAVNSSDEINPATDFSFNNLSSRYQATISAKSNSIAQVVAGGAAAANAELINLLFDETVTNNLDCIKADSTNKAQCMAGMVQKNELERNNLRAAANENQMLQYAGQFGSLVIDLLIGLGPVVWIFMMFSGTSAQKHMVGFTHMMVWPQLVTGVGAEIINGIAYANVADFMTTIRQGGIISPALAIEAYKALSLKIGTASQLMSGLPAIIASIFMLGGATRAMASTQQSSARDNSTGGLVAPQVMTPAPIVRSEAMASAQMLDGGMARMTFAGAQPMASTSEHFGNLTKEESRTLASVTQRQQTISEGQQNLKDWREAFRTGDYSRVGVDRRTGEAVHSNYEKAMRTQDSKSSSTSVAGNETNTNQALASMNVGAGVKAGVNGASAGVSAGASASTNTQATDALSRDQRTGKDHQVQDSQALTHSIHDVIDNSKVVSRGSESSHNLERSLAKQTSFQKTLSESKSDSETASTAVRGSSSFIAATAKIGDDEIGLHSQRNSDYKMFQAVNGAKLEQTGSMSEYMSKATEGMNSGTSSQLLGSDQARQAVVRHRAAVMMAQDEAAAPEQRLEALRYLSNEAKAMTQFQFSVPDTAYKPIGISQPHDATGLQPIVRSASSSEPQLAHTQEKYGRNSPSHQNTVSGSQYRQASSTSQPHSTRKFSTSNTHSLPVPNSNLQAHKEPGSDDFKKAIADSVYSQNERIGNQVTHNEAIAKKAGLGRDGDRTAIRTAKNVADNVTNIVDDDNQHTRTRLDQKK